MRVSRHRTKRPTRDDVARRANVSGWTVSCVLNGDRSVSISDETRSLVLEAARELCYRPNNNARALATGRSLTVGFWSCLAYSQYRAHFLHRMQTIVKNSSFELVIRGLHEDGVRDSDLLSMHNISVDGIIALDTPSPRRQFIGTVSTGSTPFVSVGAFWADDGDYVGCDLYAGAVAAIEHLLETGRRRIVYVLPRSEKDKTTEARYRAYIDVLAAAGLEPSIILTDDVNLSATWKAVTEYVGEHPSVDGLFCHNDDMAFGAHRALFDLGRRLGYDVALVGCDGIEETEYLSPPLTTVVQPIDELCQLAWEFLQNRIQNPELPPQQRILKPRLVIRASSLPADLPFQHRTISFGRA